MPTSVKINSGETINYTPATDVAAGDVILQGSLFGVALTAIPAGRLGALAISGIFRITKLSSDNVTAGAVLYWDNANKRVTLSASGNTRIGLAVAASPSGQATADVLINR
jgi:predicted RecA/RadA family phage recombinase